MDDLLESFFTQIALLQIPSELFAFIIIFTLVYVTLRVARVFEGHKGARIGVALVMALAFIIPHVLGTYPECWDLVVMMNNSIYKIALLVIALVFFLVVLHLVGLSAMSALMNGVLLLASLAYVIYTLLTSRGDGCPTVDLSGPWVWLLAAVALFFLIFMLVSGGKRTGGAPAAPPRMYP